MCSDRGVGNLRLIAARLLRKCSRLVYPRRVPGVEAGSLNQRFAVGSVTGAGHRQPGEDAKSASRDRCVFVALFFRRESVCESAFRSPVPGSFRRRSRVPRRSSQPAVDWLFIGTACYLRLPPSARFIVLRSRRVFSAFPFPFARPFRFP